MSTTNTEQMVAKQVDIWTNEIVASRDSISKAMRGGQNALREARTAALALAAIHPGHGFIEAQEKHDGELREVVAELAGLFVDETTQAVVEVEHGQLLTAEKLIDLAAQAIALRLRGRVGDATFDDALVGWLARLESATRRHTNEYRERLDAEEGL